ncbi:acetyltransferase [Sodiomyces alkalinus F11]|uniref:Acetyltransferase n=1 Tax=Sodiomyces alkalinus (strain CBS 110278 / VKM F-3762 / F11) TaxID=1314773 RepID=A0A3N2Q1C6_SODAK|nr:acetyltransferase [Sodiomyces alkalinus F11]ROT40550.1 acetyltransferase [Sodiomyces alkalinus F11]
MASPSGTTYLFSPTEHTHLIPYLAALHAQCITHDRSMLTFLPPLSHDKLLAWWKERIAEVSAGTRLIVILLDESEPGTKPKGRELMGVVMLVMPMSETGPMRGFMEKLLVHTKFRRRGAARELLQRLEGEAVRRGRTLLMTDAETGSPAEEIYKKFGFVEIGKIPQYGISPNNPSGELRDETFFYKRLGI